MERVGAVVPAAGAPQQPVWDNATQVRQVREMLATRPALVTADDVATLLSRLAGVVAGEALVVQAGDCAEDPDECTEEHVRRKCAVLDLLAGTLTLATGAPVIRAGRIAGQFAKPRSNPTERIGGLDLPVYRGHMVNGPEPDPESRRPDPLRILTGYMAASDVMGQLGWLPGGARRTEPLVWTSHEALLLDYEIPMIRETGTGRPWLASTHWPWIGERTRQVDGPHVALLAGVANPVACKVGPTMTRTEILRLCEMLDPDRVPGRLTFIARMGADVVADRLPALVAAVRAAGHPVIWLSDPMHGNTITADTGRKTRLVATVARELVEFRAAVTRAGGVAGGVHLETTPDNVAECLSDAAIPPPALPYSSLCDPRLNPTQALSVVAAWAALS